MSQKLPLPVSPVRLLILQLLLLGIVSAYPYLLIPSSSVPESRRLVKRAFDRFDNSGVFSFGAKRFDRYDDDDFSYGYPESGHIFKRSVPVKRAFDRMDGGDFFGAKRKRSFDRIGGTEFGLMKRSSAGEDREQLIDNLTESIMALRKARESESRGNRGSQPVLVNFED